MAISWEDEIVAAINLPSEGVLRTRTSVVKASSGRDVLELGSCGIRTEFEPKLTSEVLNVF